MIFLILTSYSGIFLYDHEFQKKNLFQQKCPCLGLDEFFMNLDLEVQACSSSYSHNSWCIHSQELLCAGRVGWIWERSSVEHHHCFVHQLNLTSDISFHQLNFHCILSFTGLSLQTVSSSGDFCFLEARRYLLKSSRPEISPTVGILLSQEHISS